MTKEEILGQAEYKQAMEEFLSKSMDFDQAAKALSQNRDAQKKERLEQESKSAWALFCYQMSYLLYLADHIKDDDATAAAEAAKDLRKLVFSHLQGKYEYIMLITKPQNP